MAHEPDVEPLRALRPAIPREQYKHRRWHARQYRPQNRQPHKSKSKQKEHPTDQLVGMYGVFFGVRWSVIERILHVLII